MNNKALDMEKTEVDPETGLGVKGRRRMALLLQVSERQLDRLTAEGVLPQRPDGLYAITQTIDRHAVYLAEKSHKSSPLDGVHAKQIELIQRRLDREARESIAMPAALVTVDTVRSAFIDAIVETGELAGQGHDEPERARRREIARQAAAQLDAKIGIEVEELRTGKRAEE